MPLHPKHRQRCVRKGFDGSVVRAGKRAQAFSQPVNRLVVRAVHRKPCAVQRAQQAALGTNRVQAILAAALAVALYMLAQRTAEKDIDDLKSPANAEKA